MPDRFYMPVELPDGSADPAAPDISYIAVYGKGGKLYARTAAGAVIDLSFALSLATKAQAEAGTNNAAYMTALRTAQAITAQRGQKVTRSYIATIDGTGTFTFPQAWASPPIVQLTAVTTANNNRPVVANIISGPTTTTVGIAVREIAGLIIAFREEDIHIYAHGVLA